MQNRSQPGKNTLEIKLFGAFSVADPTGAFTLQGRKDRAVLAYLAAHPGVPIARDRLVGLVWPDAATGSGRASLRQSLSTIRKVLAPVSPDRIVADRDTVTLIAEDLWTDVGALDAACSGSKLETERPIAFEGTYLDDLSAISTEFDAWRATEEARVSALASRYLCEQAELAQREKRFSDVLTLLSRAAAIDPFAEPVCRKLMQTHATMGRPDVALRLYRSLEVLLETELGVRPEPETQALARDIRARRNSGKTSEPIAPPTESEVGTEMDRPAVLVTPFVEGDHADDYFASSFTESVILALARFHETPVMDMKTVKIASSVHGEDPVPMALAVGARHVLSGTIRRTSSRLRVNARLTEAESGRTIWAEKYDRDMGDIIDIEDDLSARVATAIAGKIEREDQRRARMMPASDMEIIDLVMRGRYFLNQYTKSGEETARQNFEEALRRDPDCVPALAGLAVSHIHDFESSYTTQPEKKLLTAQKLAERAVALDGDDAHARYAFASVLYYQGGHELAIQHCNRALDINPNDYHNLCSQGWFLTFGGAVKEGLACNAKAISLNPYAPNGCLMVAGFGKIIEGDPKGAVQTLTAIRADNMFKQGGLAACYALLNRPRDSEIAAVAFRDLAEDDFPGDADTGFTKTRDYWRRMFCFANGEDEERFFGALNKAGIPV